MLAALLLLASTALASPIAIELASTPSLLSTSAITALTPFAYYATAAYCTPASLLAWDCGTNCAGNPGFKPVAAGGNGDSVQYCACGRRYASVLVADEHAQGMWATTRRSRLSLSGTRARTPPTCTALSAALRNRD
jgi:hypothetical protein